jgi:hypothetical protein
VSRLGVLVLLDTGPTDDDLAEIAAAFGEIDMDAHAEGHPFGGPPSGAFLIAVVAPLVVLFDAMVSTAGPQAPAALHRLATRLTGIRADERRWGRKHALKLEDTRSSVGVLLPPDLPGAAYHSLLEVDLSGFDRGSPSVTIGWNPRLGRWQVAATELTHRHLARRLPTRPRAASAAPTGVREVSHAEQQRLWALSDPQATCVVTWQRAEIVLASAAGWSVGTIARRTLLSEQRVRAVVHNFNLDGLASLSPSYDGGLQPALTPQERQEAREVAASAPASYGLALSAWDLPRLLEFLVAEGVVEDLSYPCLTALLADDGLGARVVVPDSLPGL